MIPKKEVSYLFDLSDEEYTALQLFAKKVALAMKKALPCERIGVTVIGLEVPHAHIHLVPITKESDMNFSKPKMTLDPAEMVEIKEKITKYID